LSPHVRGHLLQFDHRPAPNYPGSIGARLLASAVVIEIVRLVLIATVRSIVPLLVVFPLLLAAALAMLRFSGLTFSQVGLRPWREWTPTERSYFLQVIVIANVVFPLLLGAALRDRMAATGLTTMLLSVFVPYLFYGFYQEVVYRGMVQMELVRRYGAVAGILGANLLYTFGPLHYYYVTSYPSQLVSMFAAVYAIGLLFGVLYHRSGNLWIVGVMHAIGNAYMVSSLSALR